MLINEVATMTNIKRILALSLASICTFSSIAAQPALWRNVSPENTLYMELDAGRVVIELNTDFAPKHVDHIKKLVRDGFYDNRTFYRVIDQFVIQGGNPMLTPKDKWGNVNMQPEFEREIPANAPFTLAQSPDLFADQTGFINGFAVARDTKVKKEWLIHCAGTINLARGMDPASGTTDFAIMLGQAPRHLDRNMSIFGRVIYGMEHLNAVTRGERDKNGIIYDESKQTRINKLSVAADLPVKQQLKIRMLDTASEAFKGNMKANRERSNAFYVNKGTGALDVCYQKVDVRVQS